MKGRKKPNIKASQINNTTGLFSVDSYLDVSVRERKRGNGKKDWERIRKMGRERDGNKDKKSKYWLSTTF